MHQARILRYFVTTPDSFNVNPNIIQGLHALSSNPNPLRPDPTLSDRLPSNQVQQEHGSSVFITRDCLTNLSSDDALYEDPRKKFLENLGIGIPVRWVALLLRIHL